MRTHWLSIFESPAEDGSPLTFEGVQEGEELVQGRLLSSGEEVAQVVDGVVSFSRCDNWPADSIERFRKDGLIERNWRNGVSNASQPRGARWCDALASAGGPILEVAAGPGGGNVPGVLHRNPDAMLLINDSSPGILSLWKEFLDERGIGPSICLAAFDATKMPIGDNAIAAISNVSGFGNIDREGGPETGVQEACRVLQPGGRVYSFELMVHPEDLGRMPLELRSRLSHAPLAGGIADVLKANGLSIEMRQVSFCRMGDPAQDGVAKRAQEYGVEFRWNREVVEALKPAG